MISRCWLLNLAVFLLVVPVCGPTGYQPRGGATARTPSSFVGASTSGTLAPPLATMRPVRSLSGRRSQGTPCVSPRAPPTREMRCSSRPSYRRASRGFWVPSGLGFRCSWCLVCTVPSAFRFATRLPTLSMIKPAHNHQRGCLLCTRRAEVEPTLYFLALYLFPYPTYAAHELPQGHQGQVPVTPTKSECKSVLVDNSSGFLTIIERRRAFNQGS